MAKEYPKEQGECLYTDCNNLQYINCSGRVNFFCNKHYKIVNKFTYTIRYGKIEGKKKWEEMRKRRNSSKTKKSFTERYGKQKAEKICKSFSTTKEDLIEKYGEKKAKKICFERGQRQRREYYLEEAQCNYDLADWLLSKRQSTFSKKKCIEKYGKRKGLKIWKDRQDSWQNTLNSKSQEEIDRINKSKAVTLEKLIEKYGKYKGTLNYYNWKRLISKNFKYLKYSISKVGTEFLNTIENKLSINIRVEEDIGDYAVDGLYKNTVIEFYGDYWHCNPKYYKPDYWHDQIKMTASEKWDSDKKRINYLKECGYDTIIVWEDDWTNNKEQVIKECCVKLEKL